MSHTCHAKDCDVDVPPKMFMCKKHWYMLPKDKQRAIWREYRDDQEVRKDPTEKYLEVARDAIDWLYAHEQELAAKKAAAGGRPGTHF
jgi:hypothetical protein